MAGQLHHGGWPTQQQQHVLCWGRQVLPDHVGRHKTLAVGPICMERGEKDIPDTCGQIPWLVGVGGGRGPGPLSHPCPHPVNRTSGNGPGDPCVCALSWPCQAGLVSQKPEPTEKQGSDCGMSANGEGTFWGLIQSEPELKLIGVSCLQLLQVLP